MDQKTLWQHYRSLPEEVQQQVVDFMAFLHQKYGSAPVADTALPDLTHEPFVGMWRDRSDMNDPCMWLRDIRRDEWRDRKN